jgi:hypothetical protein
MTPSSPPPFLRLPIAIDIEGLRSDLARCLEHEWPAHFNTRDYEGGWSALSLRSASGSETDITAHPDPARRYLDTPLLATCPHVAAILGRLPCRTEGVRLLRQAPGGEIKPHRDAGLAYHDGVFRLHVPIVTNPDVEFVVAGQRVPMEPGECWFADFSQAHSVVNRGGTERVHLVIDCVREPRTDAWFLGAGFDPAGLVPPPMSDDLRRKVVAELRLQGTPAAVALAAKLEAEALAAPAIVLTPPAAADAEANAAASAHHVAAMCAFLDRIGLPWAETTLPEATFLPGVELAGGVLRFDRAKLKYPGDLLHEAGHFALCPSDLRARLQSDVTLSVPDAAGLEVGVILWSYAACLAAAIPLDVVLHAGGYKGGAARLRENFERGTYIGLPLLVWMGLCENPARARSEGRQGFPHMNRWLRA